MATANPTKAKAKPKFVELFENDVEKLNSETIADSSEPPRYWYPMGNYVLNRILSGGYKKGIPQGRITDIAGPSGAGKSYISSNIVAAAQRAGAFCLVIDTENALDNDFMSKIGVNVHENYKYYSVTTINEASKIVSKFLTRYKESLSDSEEAPQVLILIDSLDMLMTATELEHFEKGETKGDQGQKNKQLKAMLRTFVQAIKQLNVAIVCTSQVYKNQDVTNGEGLWIVSDAVKYACSQIVLVQKRKLKDATAGEVSGVRMVCEGYKTRFTKPFQKVEVEVPYDTGMDQYSGLMEVAVKTGVVKRSGAWYSLKGSDDKWRSADLAQYADRIVDMLEEQTTDFLDTDAEIDTSEDSPSK